MSDRYQEIRGILEDLVGAWTGAEHAALRRARDHLQTHCERCGRTLVGAASDAISNAIRPEGFFPGEQQPR